MTSDVWLGAERIELDVCESTNDIALVHAREGATHGTVVIADAQTAGRGRLGRVWASPAGTNVYLSAIVRAPRSLAELAPMTLAIGIGVVDAVRAAGVPTAALKWPNDVVVGTKKLAGILCEVATDGCVVAGIGVNVNVRAHELPPEIAARATSIADARGETIDRAAFVDALLREIAPWIDRFVQGGVPAIAAAWEQRMATHLVLRVERAGSPITGTAVGLDRDGALELRDGTGVIHRIHAGDVAIP
ncbi:MAG TPA: biotin--[acetyl-CoA-carboxylase] ligase [Kofleriaceae bacterium]|nr:biotin--[acetyl-CoA-carboxylase] ligase [Kofleriaceae bacterium]